MWFANVPDANGGAADDNNPEAETPENFSTYDPELTAILAGSLYPGAPDDIRQSTRQGVHAAVKNGNKNTQSQEEDGSSEENATHPNDEADQEQARHVGIKEQAERKLEKIDSLLKKIGEGVKSAEAVSNLLIKRLKDEKDPKSRKNLEELQYKALTHYDEFQGVFDVLHEAKKIAETIRDWYGGTLAPEGFLKAMEDARGVDTESGENVDSNIEQARKILNASAFDNSNEQGPNPFPNATNALEWNTYAQKNGASNKIFAIRMIGDAVNCEHDLKQIQDLIDAIDEANAESDDVKKINQFKEKLEDDAMSQDLESNIKKPKIRFDITFYSIMDFYEGAKGWWESYKNAWSQAAKLRRGKIQNKIADSLQWLPYGKAAQTESVKSLDGEHRKRRGEYKEELSEEKPQFFDLFGEGKLFEEHAKDPDKAMAILEYAADRGWLYSIKNNYEVDGKQLLEENIFPSHWDRKRRDLYLDNLTGQNESGYEKERKEATSSIKNKYEQNEGFLKEFVAYLEQGNFASAQGVMDAMYERGIDGDEGPIIATHFFRTIRSNPQLQRYLSPILLQTLSKSSAGKGHFTMSNLFMDRAALSRQALPGKLAENMERGGSLAQAIHVAEQRIAEAAGGAITQQQLDAYVAKILVGKPVKVHGRLISIWDKEFEFYRHEEKNVNFALMDASGLKGTPNEYFGGDSEVLMANQAFMTALFNTTSTGTWENSDKAQNFVGRLIERYQAMRKAYKDVPFANSAENPAEIFRKEIGSKIQVAINQSISRSDTISKYSVKLGNRTMEMPAVGALHELGFIDLNAMGEQGRKHWASIQTDETMKDQLKKLRFETFGI